MSESTTVTPAASEDTPLLSPSDSSAPLEPSPPNPDNNNNNSQRLWEELSQPWPSTFERSISLLASPVIRATEADLYTKSPKPGSTPLALANRQALRRKHDKTPEPHVPPSLGVAPPALSKGDMAKVHSLDLASRSFAKEQQKKAAEAKEYRAKILQKQEEGTVSNLLSPGYHREKASMHKKKKSDAHAPPKADGKSSFLQCAFNLANILMGTGILGLPYACKCAGFWGGTLGLVAFGLVTWRTSILIGRELNGDPRPSSVFVDSPYKSPLRPGSTPEARMLPPIHSFPDIARTAFGDIVCVFLSIILYFELFSCICVFLVMIGDHLHQLFPTVATETFLCIAAGVSIVPTIILKTPALLSYFSMVGTIATVSVVVAVVCAALIEGNIAEEAAVRRGFSNTGEPYHAAWRPDGLTIALGLVAYCFSGHAIVPSIYTNMQKPNEFEGMVSATYVVVVGSCLAVAISGYYMFGDVVMDQVTLSLEANSSASTIMDGLTWLMILTAFSKTTLTMFPLALGLEEIVAPFLTSEKWVDAASTIIKLFMTCLALTVSIFVPSFSFLCALVGMVCTMSVSMIFPSAAYLKLFWSKLSLWEKMLDFAFVIFGTYMAIVGTVATLRSGK